MRRADRLFKLVQLLRSGRVITARSLADKLEVAERTIYRDVRDLLLSGVPIEGEAGVGYVMRGGYDLPPLMFTRQEIEALIIGARMVEAWGGASHAKSAELALSKIEAAVPWALKTHMANAKVFSPSFNIPEKSKKLLDSVFAATFDKRTLSLCYRREDGQASRRKVRPLGLYYWGKVWTLVAWCELRGDFRTFRVDRIEKLSVKDAFTMEEGKTLEDYLEKARETYAAP